MINTGPHLAMDKIITSVSLLLLSWILMLPVEAVAFEVKGKGVSSVVWLGGKANVSKCTDEVIYDVDPDNKTITRTAISNNDLKDNPLSGLQSDNTKYKIIYDSETLITRPKAKQGQRVIKAIGQAGMGDGFETIVIGEDFITTSSSKWDYFVLYYYDRAT